MTRFQERFALAVKRTQTAVFTHGTFKLPRTEVSIICSVGQIEGGAGENRNGGGGRTTVRRRIIKVLRTDLPTTPPAGQTIKLTVEDAEQSWEVESFTSDAVLWSVTLKAPNQS